MCVFSENGCAEYYVENGVCATSPLSIWTPPPSDHYSPYSSPQAHTNADTSVADSYSAATSTVCASPPPHTGTTHSQIFKSTSYIHKSMFSPLYCRCTGTFFSTRKMHCSQGHDNEKECVASNWKNNQHLSGLTRVWRHLLKRHLLVETRNEKKIIPQMEPPKWKGVNCEVGEAQTCLYVNVILNKMYLFVLKCIS